MCVRSVLFLPLPPCAIHFHCDAFALTMAMNNKMQSNENRIGDGIDFVVAPIAFDNQSKNLAKCDNGKKALTILLDCVCVWQRERECLWKRHQQLQLNIVIEDIEWQFQWREKPMPCRTRDIFSNLLHGPTKTPQMITIYLLFYMNMRVFSKHKCTHTHTHEAK